MSETTLQIKSVIKIKYFDIRIYIPTSRMYLKKKKYNLSFKFQIIIYLYT